MKTSKVISLSIFSSIILSLSTQGMSQGEDTATKLAAEFVSQLFPSHVAPGETFKVIIQYRNIGKANWNGLHQKISLIPITKDSKADWGVDKIHLDKDSTVDSNSVVTFSFSATAPTKPGLYPFQWNMTYNNSETLGNLTPESFIEVGNMLNGSETAVANAEFIAAHTEKTMVSGEEYDVAMVFKNIGETTWWAGNTSLISENPKNNLIWFINNVEYGEAGTTPPNDIHAFRFSIRAPEEAGKYNFQWQLFDTTSNTAYGEKSDNITITVLAR